MRLSLPLLFTTLGGCYALGSLQRTPNEENNQLAKRGPATRADNSLNETLIVDTSTLVPRQHSKCTTKGCAGSKKASRPFVTMRKGQMVLENGTPFRFASFNAPDLLAVNDDFEAEDTMRTIAGLGRGVARTYTLVIKGTSPHIATGAHITGWDNLKKDWIYNELMFKKMDTVLALAYKHNVRLIIPIIGQDVGLEANWVGNYVDLIIHRKNSTWDYETARTKVDFFKDAEMIEGYKKIVTFLLNRINTVSGLRYGDDPTILAWQTGNEMMYTTAGKKGPAPGAWTAAVAAHFKSLAPRTLVADGSLARQDCIQDSHAPEALASPHVDLLCYHYYGSGDFNRIKTEPAYIRSFGKGFLISEYGFVTDPKEYKTLLDLANKNGAVGTLVWSLRAHSSKGGFLTHREDEATAAYHAPGWPNPIVPAGTWVKSANWDEKEYNIVKIIRDASFTINGDRVKKEHSIELPPKVWLNAVNRTITWQGVPWAMSYEAWMSKPSSKRPHRGHGHGLQWTRIGQNLLDAVEAGSLAWPLPSSSKGSLRMRAVGPDGSKGPWSNVITV